MKEEFKSSEESAKVASEVLKDDNATSTEKSLAGSVLSLVNEGKEPSDEIKHLAGQVLENKNSTDRERILAACILGQSKKNN